MNRPTMIRFGFLVLALALTAVAGFPVDQAEAATCCELESQNCAAECAEWGGVAQFECLPIGRSCKYYCECNF